MNYIIASVTYTRDENGQHGVLTLMPPEAFDVEPSGPLGLVTMEDIQHANNPTKKETDTATPLRVDDIPTSSSGIATA